MNQIAIQLHNYDTDTKMLVESHILMQSCKPLQYKVLYLGVSERNIFNTAAGCIL